MQKFRQIKKEIRILAWDDGPFEFKSKGKTVLIGVVFRGGNFMDGLLKTEIDVDGNDAQHRIIEMTKQMKFKDVRVMMLDGITFGGFNTVDIKEIYEKTRIPVIVVNRKKPNIENFMKIAKDFDDSDRKMKCIEDAGPFYFADLKNTKICFQCYGLDSRDAGQIIKVSTTHSNMPEPLRIAHIIAGGIVLGESVGHA